MYHVSLDRLQHMLCHWSTLRTKLCSKLLQASQSCMVCHGRTERLHARSHTCPKRIDSSSLCQETPAIVEAICDSIFTGAEELRMRPHKPSGSLSDHRAMCQCNRLSPN